MGKRSMAFTKAIFYFITYSTIQFLGMFIYILGFLFLNCLHAASASHLPVDQLVHNALDQLSQNMTHHTEAALLLANIMVFLVVVLLFRLKKRNLFTDLKIKKTNRNNLVAAFVVGLVWSYVLIFFLSFLYDLTSAFGDPADYTVITIVSVILIAPIMEEIFYRGIIFNQLNTRMKVASSAIITAFLFALGHHSSFVHWLLSFLWGIVSIWLYRTTGTLIVPILAHITNNAVAELVSHMRMPPFMFSCSFIVILIGTLIYIKHINRNSTSCTSCHSAPSDPESGFYGG